MVIIKDPHKSVFLLDWQDMSEVKHLFSPIPNEEQHCLPGQTWVQYETTNCTIDSFWYGSLIWANQTVSYNFCVMCCIVQLLVWTSSGTFKQKVMETNWRWAMGWVDMLWQVGCWGWCADLWNVFDVGTFHFVTIFQPKTDIKPVIQHWNVCCVMMR